MYLQEMHPRYTYVRPVCLKFHMHYCVNI
uniref:Uncharacterized protein n=1 Tax=Rhizophora mucronata TaxID=61149 RepID=A0A2P2P8R5_RHIMU